MLCYIIGTEFFSLYHICVVARFVTTKSVDIVRIRFKSNEPSHQFSGGRTNSHLRVKDLRERDTRARHSGREIIKLNKP